MRFDDCLKFVLLQEGGFVNHPADKGGATNKGITQAVYDEWRLRRDLNAQSVSLISDEEVKEIYQEQYWRPVRAPIIPSPLDLVMFDSAVNHGVSRSARFLQQVVGAVVDGFFGRETEKKMNVFIKSQGVDVCVQKYISVRLNFYRQIIANNPSQKVFEKGWNNRIQRLQKAIESQ